MKFKGYLVALESMELRIYNERQLVHVLNTDVHLKKKNLKILGYRKRDEIRYIWT